MHDMTNYTEPHLDRAALITIDVQRDFTLPGAVAEVPGTADVVPCMQQVLRAFREESRPIVHVVRLYKPDGSNVDLCRRAQIAAGPSIVVPGTEGAELVDELKPSADVSLDPELLLSGAPQTIGTSEWAMYKPRWGAFYGTRLEDHLRESRVDTVVVCGCNFPNCPRTTLYEASERDFRALLVSDATSGLYDRGARELAGIGVAVEPADSVVARMPFG